jgi:hypothetical protein
VGAGTIFIGIPGSFLVNKRITPATKKPESIARKNQKKFEPFIK